MIVHVGLLDVAKCTRRDYSTSGTLSGPTQLVRLKQHPIPLPKARRMGVTRSCSALKNSMVPPARPSQFSEAVPVSVSSFDTGPLKLLGDIHALLVL